MSYPYVRQMLFSRKPTRVPDGETIFTTLARSLKSEKSREDLVREDLVHRLKPSCAGMSSAEFEALVLKMTREQLRGEGVVRRKTPPS
jgi:hypothetical protein